MNYFCVFELLIISGMTSDDNNEKLDILDQLLRSDGGTGWMHESYDMENPNQFTRSWYV
jgi:meiotically up-regulated gene 157 (Mug157) protein